MGASREARRRRASIRTAHSATAASVARARSPNRYLMMARRLALIAMDEHDLVVERPQGLYCPPGDFYIDPWQPVDRAVITHAHADHARRGHGHYLATPQSAGVLRARLGDDIVLQMLAYGEALE